MANPCFAEAKMIVTEASTRKSPTMHLALKFSLLLGLFQITHCSIINSDTQALSSHLLTLTPLLKESNATSQIARTKDISQANQQPSSATTSNQPLLQQIVIANQASTNNKYPLAASGVPLPALSKFAVILNGPGHRQSFLSDSEKSHALEYLNQHAVSSSQSKITILDAQQTIASFSDAAISTVTLSPTTSSASFINNDNDLTRMHHNPQRKQDFSISKHKICIGTTGRLNKPTNTDSHYHNLRERYKNCTFIDGNLEITWLQKSTYGDYDLSFLHSISEVTGYVLIAYVDVKKIELHNLKIIRGREMFHWQEDDYSFIVMSTNVRNIELPMLRDVLNGDIGLLDNYNLCHMDTISWVDITSDRKSFKLHTAYNNQNRTVTNDDCPSCHRSCIDGCWSDNGPSMCQIHNQCHKSCVSRRCSGPEPSQCCSAMCAGGCTGPSERDCFTCKHFSDDGVCKTECPPMMRYNPNLYSWENDPSGKFAYGSTCVKECPDYLFRDSGACVKSCPPNKRALNGECVNCDGPCPKNCTGVDLLHSGNIESFRGCTVIDGSISILDATFFGYNNSISEYSHNKLINQGVNRGQPMHPKQLEVFSTLREITGSINIQANHSEFKDLSFLRNLEIIGGQQPIDMFYALSITKTSLVSLNLRSLKLIRANHIIIHDNPDLCFVDTISWNKFFDAKHSSTGLHSEERPNVISANADPAKCKAANLKCHEQCANSSIEGGGGCWGKGANECSTCKRYKLNNETCVQSCAQSDTLGHLAFDADNLNCLKCHEECAGGCNGTDARSCFRCKNVKDGPYCVAKCPIHKYNYNGVCFECHKSCVEGCTGPTNKLGHKGCNLCGKTVLANMAGPHSNELYSSNQTMNPNYCVRMEEECPLGYFFEFVGPHFLNEFVTSLGLNNTNISSNATQLGGLIGKPVCRKCHDLCRSCTGIGTHTSVCTCAKYNVNEQCEEHCSRDYYADEVTKKCHKCAPECNGCTGPTEADCVSCRVYRIYHQLQPQQTGIPNMLRFNCTDKCPSNKPFRSSDTSMLDPYCSDRPDSTSMDSDKIDWLLFSALGLSGSKNSTNLGSGNMASASNIGVSILGSAAASSINNNNVLDGNMTLTSGSLSSVLLLSLVSVALIASFALYRCQLEKNKTNKLRKSMICDDAEPLAPSNVKPNLAPLRSIKETELRYGKPLGSGFGGVVYQGTWIPEGGEAQQVAIKKLRDNGQSNMNKEFLDEAYIMASVQHKNLVRLLAVCMTPSNLMLVTPLMPLGCLLDYVIKHRNELTAKIVLEWCLQIARGMEYLEKHRMVHRDLALRNVLLQRKSRALITDFGLAKFLEINQTEYYSGGGRLPFKWLAPECFKERIFTHKSDVWAFGVTIWELLTWGGKPFEEYEPIEVPAAIEAGARLEKPAHVSIEIYKVLLACWVPAAEARPSFSELVEAFAKFARDPLRYLVTAKSYTSGDYYNIDNIDVGKDLAIDDYLTASGNTMNNRKLTAQELNQIAGETANDVDLELDSNEDDDDELDNSDSDSGEYSDCDNINDDGVLDDEECDYESRSNEIRGRNMLMSNNSLAACNCDTSNSKAFQSMQQQQQQQQLVVVPMMSPNSKKFVGASPKTKHRFDFELRNSSHIDHKCHEVSLTPSGCASAATPRLTKLVGMNRSSRNRCFSESIDVEESFSLSASPTFNNAPMSSQPATASIIAHADISAPSLMNQRHSNLTTSTDLNNNNIKNAFIVASQQRNDCRSHHLECHQQQLNNNIWSSQQHFNRQEQSTVQLPVDTEDYLLPTSPVCGKTSESIDNSEVKLSATKRQLNERRKKRHQLTISTGRCADSPPRGVASCSAIAQSGSKSTPNSKTKLGCLANTVQKPLSACPVRVENEEYFVSRVVSFANSATNNLSSAKQTLKGMMKRTKFALNSASSWSSSSPSTLPDSNDNLGSAATAANNNNNSNNIPQSLV